MLGPNTALRDALLAQLGSSVEMEVDAVTVSPQVRAQCVCYERMWKDAGVRGDGQRTGRG